MLNVDGYEHNTCTVIAINVCKTVSKHKVPPATRTVRKRRRSTEETPAVHRCDVIIVGVMRSAAAAAGAQLADPFGAAARQVPRLTRAVTAASASASAIVNLDALFVPPLPPELTVNKFTPPL